MVVEAEDKGRMQTPKQMVLLLVLLCLALAAEVAAAA